MLALKNLARKKIRSLLTLMGVSMGISVFVCVTSYSQNLKIQIQEVITNGFDIVVQEKGAATPFYSKISHSDYAKLKGIAGIDQMPTVVLGHIRTEKNPYFILIGISSIELLLGDIAVVEGRLFGSSENEILLG